MMKSKVLTLCLCTCSLFAQAQTESLKELSIVPFPKEIQDNKNENFKLKDDFTIACSKDLMPLAELFIHDVYKLYGTTGQTNKDTGSSAIVLTIDEKLAEEEYQVKVSDKQILVSGHDYNSVSMGVTTVLQLTKADGGTIEIPAVDIKDAPSIDYRTFMLDVARKPIDIETIRQSIDLCRWYKVKYMQIHLTDNEQFTFTSKKYPQLTSDISSYSVEELKGLVEYAKTRGVILIPEFDVPGHTDEIRRRMPELFGKRELDVIDITREEVCVAIETIIKEMMGIFYTSPYFHIGGDEARLGNFAKEEHVKDYIRKKGYDNVEDVYLEFIVRLHNFIKKQGKQTLVWEGFRNKGSQHVAVPEDMIVIAFETAYQRPESLLKNNYPIINAAWKPMYICPGIRWSPESIYDWNPRKWQSPFFPIGIIQLPEYAKEIVGGEMCAWEMNDAEHIASSHQRVPAFSEVAWHNGAPQSFQEYDNRYSGTDEKFMRLIFPAEIERKGFKLGDILYHLNQNMENSFTEKATIKVKPLLENTYVTFTDNGSKPTKDSRKATEITITENRNIRLGLFNAEGEMIGYRNFDFRLQPITASFIGDMEPVKDRRSDNPKEMFKDRIIVRLDCKDNLEIHYTTDGSEPSASSPLYTDHGILVDKNMKIRAQCYFKGYPYGEPYISEFGKVEEEKVEK